MRRGISLLEVLVAMFVLSIGILGVAALVPLGKLALVEVEKSDRCGPCGRAGVRDVRVRGLANTERWSIGAAPGVRVLPTDPMTSPYLIDPLGQSRGLTSPLGPLVRCTLLDNPLPPIPNVGNRWSVASAESVFYWQDDLVFSKPENWKGVGSPPNGNRPIPNGTGCHFSWFITAQPREPKETQAWDVAVAVCWNRDFSSGEHVIPVNAVTGSAGGATVELSAACQTATHGQWAMLSGYHTVVRSGVPTPAVACRWYKIANVANGLTPPLITLVGPDWDLDAPSASTPVNLIVVDRTIGVYSTTITSETDLLWQR